MQKAGIAEVKLCADDRVLLVSRTGDRVEARAAGAQTPCGDVDLPTQDLIFENSDRARSGQRATASQRCVRSKSIRACFGARDKTGKKLVESGLDDIDAGGNHAWIITHVGTMYHRAMYNRGMQWKVYLSGEIHTDWRTRIEEGIRKQGLPVTLSSPVTDHAASDDCGVAILGEEAEGVWKDHKGAGVNAIRTRNQIREADVVVVRFGDKYRQWNAAFDAGFAAALGKTMITLHPPELTHALKEVDRAALAVAETPEQVVEILEYISRA